MATKYFAQIDGAQKGPFTLEQLPGAGVTPDTWVWAKGMDDWLPACDVPEICRYYRQRLAGTLTPPSAEASGPAGKSLKIDLEKHQDNPPSPARPSDRAPSQREQFARMMQEIFEEGRRQAEEEQGHPTHPPRSPLALAILSALLCFPPTGIVAIVLCIRSSRQWHSAGPGQEGDEMRRKSYDSARLAGMWTGITFFFGIIAMAAMWHFGLF